MPQNAVDYKVITGVEGMEEFTALINRVNALDKEMNRFKQAVNSIQGPMNRNKRVLQDSTKQARLAQIGTQQLGMQFNDLATSVSAGMNPLMAFQQQIGQIGFAMTQMQGKAKGIGAFIAGPWGAAILLGTMALSKLADGLFEGREGIEDLDKAMDMSKWTAEDLTDVNELLAESNKEVGRTSMQAAVHLRDQATAHLSNAKAALADLEAAAAKFTQDMQMRGPDDVSIFDIPRMIGMMSASSDAEALQENIDNLRTTINGSEFDIARMTGEFGKNGAEIERLESRINELREEYKGSGEDAKRQAEILTELSQKQGELATLKEKSSRASEENGKQMTAEERAMAKLNKEAQDLINKYNAGAISSSEFSEQAAGLAMNMQQTERSFRSASEKVQEVADRFWDAQKRARDLREELSKRFADGAKPLIPDDIVIPDSVLEYTEKVMDDMSYVIYGYTEEMKKSFDQVGLAVSNSFMNMLSGAMSWKQGLMGIIQAVISELWKLYVVQQIVGFVTDMIGGLGLPKKASGGTVKEKQPYIVGERGPEVFVPGRSGTIVPHYKAGQMGGGGGSNFNITVDARGATDPAAIDARVRQGIMQAAPALIRAAESKTMTGLARPRLGGAIR